MARYWYGGGIADWAFSAGDGNTVSFAPGTELLCSNAKTGGTQYTDLLDEGGSPIATVTTGDGTFDPPGALPRFQAPDGVLWMWIGEDGGSRVLIQTTDLPDLLAGKLDTSGGTMTGELRLSDDSPAASQDYVAAHGGGGGAPSIQVFGYTGILSVTTGTARVYNDTDRSLTIGTVRASAGVGPVGQSLIVDVNLDGTSIWATTTANRPTIADGAVTGTAGAPDTATWPVGSYLTIDVDQVGTTTPGSGLTVTVPAT